MYQDSRNLSNMSSIQRLVVLPSRVSYVIPPALGYVEGTELGKQDTSLELAFMHYLICPADGYDSSYA